MGLGDFLQDGLTKCSSSLLHPPVDGSWSTWSSWSHCDACIGEAVRSRDCNNPPARFGGRPCPGEAQQTRPCHDGTTSCEGESKGQVGIAPALFLQYLWPSVLVLPRPRPPPPCCFRKRLVWRGPPQHAHKPTSSPSKLTPEMLIEPSEEDLTPPPCKQHQPQGNNLPGPPSMAAEKARTVL